MDFFSGEEEKTQIGAAAYVNAYGKTRKPS